MTAVAATPSRATPAEAAAPVLRATDVVKHFSSGGTLFTEKAVVRAVDGVSLEIGRREVFSIVGESGCGKSTLGRCLLRLIEPTSGSVAYEGRDILAASASEMRALRREMQIIFQDPFASLNPRMNVGQIVGEPIWLHGIGPRAERRDRVTELLRTVGLRPTHANRYPHEFSGGQRQRIGIARALASDPKLIIADEPVSALDVSIQAQIVNLLETLKERFSLTLVLIAHDLAVIRHMSDRIGVMYLGEMVETAPTEALFENPLHPYTQALIAAIPVPSPRARSAHALLQGDIPSPAKPPSGCRFHTRCPHAEPICIDVRPQLELAEGGHSVACHLWRKIAGAGASVALAPPEPSPARTRRTELYNAFRDRQEAAAPTQ